MLHKKSDLKTNYKYLFLFFKLNIFILSNISLFSFNYYKKNKRIFDQYDTNIYNTIKTKLIQSNCSLMGPNQREFLNGVIRKFKPKKILELGVNRGGSSIIILNAIKDLKNAKLFSIDLSSSRTIGECVPKFFQNYLNKWQLFTGNIAAKFMEKIGKNIDMVFIDTAHFEPGEILDFLMVFPFLRDKALVGFHDINLQIQYAGWNNSRNEWAPYLIFNILKGKKYLPSGKGILTKGIGFIKLEKNQLNYIYDYFRALGGQWQYFPQEEHTELMKKFIKRFYDDNCLTIFEEAVKFNRVLVKNNPKKRFDYKLAHSKLKELNKIK